MFVLGKTWKDGYLDYYRRANEVRILPYVWVAVERIEGQYIIRQKDWRLLWNYLWKFGCVAVVNKVLSRLHEKGRNEKFLSVGVGKVEECSQNSSYKVGDLVFFLAQNHPLCVSRVTIDQHFLLKWPYAHPSDTSGHICFYNTGALSVADGLLQYRGWSSFSSVPVEEDTVSVLLRDAMQKLQRLISEKTLSRVELPVTMAINVCEQTKARGCRNREGCKAVLFGYGNYAKTAILPYLLKEITLAGIHEIDPLQLGVIDHRPYAFDTADLPREDEAYDVYFIAGYHHSHTPIALHAVRQGAYAVIEKPLATTHSQLEALKKTCNKNPSKFFGCFQKRYSEANDWIREDLGVSSDDPITYHCIVYEIPLPHRHWYQWPVSGSRLLSNGCHWIDHFMYLNAYKDVRKKGVRSAVNGDILIFLELENDAVFTMTLTDIGSSRLGVREYGEVKTGNVTICLLDNKSYRAENGKSVLRKRRISPMVNYKRMYRSISRRIIKGMSGDSFQSLRSSEITIELDQELRERS